MLFLLVSITHLVLERNILNCLNKMNLENLMNSIDKKFWILSIWSVLELKYKHLVGFGSFKILLSIPIFGWMMTNAKSCLTPPYKNFVFRRYSFFSRKVKKRVSFFFLSFLSSVSLKLEKYYFENSKTENKNIKHMKTRNES